MSATMSATNWGDGMECPVHTTQRTIQMGAIACSVRYLLHNVRYKQEESYPRISAHRSYLASAESLNPEIWPETTIIADLSPGHRIASAYDDTGRSVVGCAKRARRKVRLKGQGGLIPASLAARFTPVQPANLPSAAW
eukprot:2984829-Rhodomonas_salina.5